MEEIGRVGRAIFRHPAATGGSCFSGRERSTVQRPEPRRNIQKNISPAPPRMNGKPPTDDRESRRDIPGIARRFNAGLHSKIAEVPKGRLNHRHVVRRFQFSLHFQPQGSAALVHYPFARSATAKIPMARNLSGRIRGIAVEGRTQIRRTRLVRMHANRPFGTWGIYASVPALKRRAIFNRSLRDRRLPAAPTQILSTANQNPKS